VPSLRHKNRSGAFGMVKYINSGEEKKANGPDASGPGVKSSTNTACPAREAAETALP
jgi:hypothetical protein